MAASSFRGRLLVAGGLGVRDRALGVRRQNTDLAPETLVPYNKNEGASGDIYENKRQ
jgi:hypothetical protein